MHQLVKVARTEGIKGKDCKAMISISKIRMIPDRGTATKLDRMNKSGNW
jgi:hypothetical protein